MSVVDLFNSMPARFQAEKAAGPAMGILFDLSGAEGGQWYVNIADGQLAVRQGAPAAAPSATVKLTTEDFDALSTGSLNQRMAYMAGKVNVESDLKSVMKFQQLVGF